MTDLAKNKDSEVETKGVIVAPDSFSEL
jgi:hypothetical protein